MKVTLSKKRRGEKRHVVLVCTRVEANAVHPILYNDVLNREAFPKRERLRNGMVRYRFAMKWLDRLLITFPYAEYSPGLDGRLVTRAAQEIAQMEVPELDIEGLTATLYDFQKTAVGRMIRKKRYYLNDEMGLGKSIMLMAGVLARGSFPALFVVPNPLKFMWERMVNDFTDATCQVVDGTAAQRREQIQKDVDFLIVNPEALRVVRRDADDVCTDDECPKTRFGIHTHLIYEFKNPGLFFEDDTIHQLHDTELEEQEMRDWTAIGVDEYHAFKNPNAQQSIGLHFLHGHRQYAMSGTPMLNGRPEELWSILHWMWPERFPSYAEFVGNHCIKKGSTVVAYKGLDDLREFFHSRSIRRRKEHVSDQLPDVIMVDTYVDLTPAQRRLYNEIKEKLRLWIDEEPRRIVSALAQLTRLKQACFSPELYDGRPESAKIDRLKQDVAELVASGEKAIIFSQWSKATRIIERELADYNPAYIDGTVKVRDRMGQVDKFNNDEDCKVFIGTIGSCKQGFTLSAASYVIHMDEGWVPADKMQASARSAAGGLRGVGTTVPVHIITYRANDTIEEDIDKLLGQKQRMNDAMVERDGGARVERVSIQDIRELLR